MDGYMQGVIMGISLSFIIIFIVEGIDNLFKGMKKRNRNRNKDKEGYKLSDEEFAKYKASRIKLREEKLKRIKYKQPNWKYEEDFGDNDSLMDSSDYDYYED